MATLPFLIFTWKGLIGTNGTDVNNPVQLWIIAFKFLRAITNNRSSTPALVPG
jgi:hypothetical protein